MSKRERRAILERDYCPEPPYDDGSFPIIGTNYGYGRKETTQATRITSYEVAPELVAAWDRWNTDRYAFERYARIFHGATSFAYRDEKDYAYVALDPADWRRWVGLTDEWLAQHPDDCRANLIEYAAYLDGDCWIIEVQEKCDLGEWHTVDSCGGFYGPEDSDWIQSELAAAGAA